MYTVYIDDQKFTGYLRRPEKEIYKYKRKVVAYLIVSDVQGIKAGTKKVVIKWPKEVFPYVINASNVLFEVDNEIVFQHGVVADPLTYQTEHVISVRSSFNSLKVYVFDKEEEIEVSQKTVIGYLGTIREFYTAIFHFPKQITSNIGLFDTATLTYCFPRSFLTDHFFDLPISVFLIPKTYKVRDPSDVIVLRFGFPRCYYENELASDMSGKGTVAPYTFPKPYHVWPFTEIYSFQYGQSYDTSNTILYFKLIGEIGLVIPPEDLIRHVMGEEHYGGLIESIDFVSAFPFQIPVNYKSIEFETPAFLFSFPKPYNCNMLYMSDVYVMTDISVLQLYDNEVMLGETKCFPLTVSIACDSFGHIDTGIHFVVFALNENPVAPFTQHMTAINFGHSFSLRYSEHLLNQAQFAYSYEYERNPTPVFPFIFTCSYGFYEWVAIEDIPPDLLFFKYVTLNNDFKMDLLLFDPDAKIF